MTCEQEQVNIADQWKTISSLFSPLCRLPSIESASLNSRCGNLGLTTLLTRKVSSKVRQMNLHHRRNKRFENKVQLTAYQWQKAGYLERWQARNCLTLHSQE